MQSLIPKTTISTLCGYRDAALAKMQEAAKTIEKGHRLAEEAAELAQLAHMGTGFYLNDRTQAEAYQNLFSNFSAEGSMDVYRQHMDARIWMYLLDATGLSKLMDRTAKDKMYEDLCADVPTVSEENAWNLFNQLAGDAELIFQRGLARAFIDLDRRFKSHDGFKLGTRIILTNVFDHWGGWNYHSRMGDTLADIERVFAVLDKTEPDGTGLRQAIHESRKGCLNPRQSVTETKYFRIKGFKNGNAHLWFLRDDLVERANLVLASYYGEVLPDGVPKGGTEADLKSKSGLPSKDLSFYPTPQAVTQQLLRDVYIREGHRVLEPSAGTGHMVKELLGTEASSITAIEINSERCHALRANKDPRLTVTQANFLQVHPRPEFDHVIMNPPFYGTHWMEHVVHAFEFLAPGGTLTTVLPISAELGESQKHKTFRKWAKSHCSKHRLFYDLPQESFAESGTRISTVTLTLHKKGA